MEDISEYYKLDNCHNIRHQMAILQNHNSTFLQLKTAIKNFPSYIEELRKTVYTDYKNRLFFTRYGVKDSIFEGICEIKSIRESLSLNILLKPELKEEEDRELKETKKVVDALKTWVDILNTKPWISVAAVVLKNWYIIYIIIWNSERRKELIKEGKYNKAEKELEAKKIKTSQELNDFVKKINEIMINPVVLKK